MQVNTMLNSYLGNLSVLYFMSLNFHWNIEDRRFFSLHELFEKQYRDLVDQMDEVAERIRQLKEKAPGTMKELLELSSLEEPNGDLTGNEMIQKLLTVHEALSKDCGTMIKKCDEFGDAVTADLLTDLQGWHDKNGWMLRSHL